MREWKNPYITLSLPPSATNADINRRAELLGRKSAEHERIARSAKEQVSHNLELIFPAFLTANPHPVFIEEELKTLRKYNRRAVNFSDEHMQDAFRQLGLHLEENPKPLAEVSQDVYALVKDEIGLHQHAETIQKESKKQGLQSSVDEQISAKNKSTIQIPQIIKE